VQLWHWPASLWPEKEPVWSFSGRREKEGAGVEERKGPITDKNDADDAQGFDVNVKGVFCSIKHEIPALLKSGGEPIINTLSIAGGVGMARVPL
jgi:NAD(P)-dependent dehydrogenase (short-subunit alcohol dehydrogenase family)